MPLAFGLRFNHGVLVSLGSLLHELVLNGHHVLSFTLVQRHLGFFDLLLLHSPLLTEWLSGGLASLLQLVPPLHSLQVNLIIVVLQLL